MGILLCATIKLLQAIKVHEVCEGLQEKQSFCSIKLEIDPLCSVAVSVLRQRVDSG